MTNIEHQEGFSPSKYGLVQALRVEEEAARWPETTEQMDAPPLATAEEIPILDLSGLRKGRAGALESFTESLAEAAFKTGFFLLKGHGVPAELERALHRQGERFRKLDEATKLSYAQNKNGVGYVPLNVRRQPRREKGNLCECIYFKREEGPRNIGWDDNQWPTELEPEFREALIAYFTAMESMAKLILPAYARLLGAPDDFFTEAFQGGLIRSRLAHYPPIEREENQFGVAPHVDTTFLTFLSRYEDEPGLCVLSKAGRWLRIPNLPGHFTVNSGELLRQWSNHRIASTAHFANAGTARRYSVPFFWHPRADYVMDCRDFPSCANDQSPPLYPPFSYLESQGPAQGE